MSHFCYMSAVSSPLSLLVFLTSLKESTETQKDQVRMCNLRGYVASVLSFCAVPCFVLQELIGGQLAA